jgi:hypothetical protein
MVSSILFRIRSNSLDTKLVGSDDRERRMFIALEDVLINGRQMTQTI